eukprot:6482012-Amphidinium_carterae.3
MADAYNDDLGVFAFPAHQTPGLWSTPTPATTKIPPSYDGRTSWFQFQESVEDWNNLPELEPTNNKEGTSFQVTLRRHSYGLP